MNDQLKEIFDTLKKNKMRTTLTGLSVSWGIFILIILLGAGNGLKNGVMQNFSSRAINIINLWTGTTSIPYRGLKSERNISFSEREVEFIQDEVKESRLITPIFNTSQTISYGKEYGTYNLRGVMPDYYKIEKLIIEAPEGRFFNQLDMKKANKVVVLDKKIANLLFPNETPIGKYVKIGQLMFKVIGVNSKKEQWGETNAYVPFSTAQAIFNPSRKLWRISFTVDGLDTEEANDKFNKSLRQLLGQRLYFDPNDDQAIWINNSKRDYIETLKIFNGITFFVGIIGILTLIAGIVGVSNIMLVSVKERTREIGIRKAIGAPPSAILKSIILESVFITTLFGYIGLMLGIGLTELINFLMIQSAGNVTGSEEVQMSIFLNPTVNIGYALFATILLIVAGIIAGYLPAQKAVRVQPIEAMRYE